MLIILICSVFGTFPSSILTQVHQQIRVPGLWAEQGPQQHAAEGRDGLQAHGQVGHHVNSRQKSIKDKTSLRFEVLVKAL